MDYKVNITQSGRGRTIYYLENDKEPAFNLESAIDGVLVFVRSPQHWNNFCDDNALPQARNRRDKILKRVCEEVICQKTSGAKYAIGDDYISISFG